MIKSHINSIKIIGMSTAVPKKKQNIMDEYKSIFGEEAVAQFSKTTGVMERRVAELKQTSSDLAYVAARTVLEKKQIEKEQIGILVFVTQTPDYIIPSTACVLHKRLGLSKNCLAFDVNLGCSGYVYGMQILIAMLQSMNIQYGLLLVGDTVNRFIHSQDKSAAMLFGDSGSATLFEKTKEDVSIHTTYKTDGEGFKTIIIPAGANRNIDIPNEVTVWGDGNERSDYNLYMNGVDTFSFTISEVPVLIKEYMKEMETNIDVYDDFVFHQANGYILKQVMKRCKLPVEKVPISMDRYGNTSVTSIPLTICDKYGDSQEDHMLRLFTCGFGIGLSWGIADFEINEKDIYPIIETEEYYKEGMVSHE